MIITNTPREISAPEWREIMKVPIVKELWRLNDDEAADTFAARIYGVRFFYRDGTPEGGNDLYILHDVDLSNAPVYLARENGILVAQPLSGLLSLAVKNENTSCEFIFYT